MSFIFSLTQIQYDRIHDRRSCLVKIIDYVNYFNSNLKDDLMSSLCFLNIEIKDLVTFSYRSADVEVGHHVSSSPIETSGLVACGTSVGANTFSIKYHLSHTIRCSKCSLQQLKCYSPSHVSFVYAMYSKMFESPID